MGAALRHLAANYAVHFFFEMGLRDGITKLRIEHAERMLFRLPERTIQEISEKSEFLLPSHAIRTFREHKPAHPPSGIGYSPVPGPHRDNFPGAHTTPDPGD